MNYRIMSYGERLQRVRTEGSKTWKITLCPICGREDMCSIDAELESCWFCTQLLCQRHLVRTPDKKIVPANEKAKELLEERKNGAYY